MRQRGTIQPTVAKEGPPSLSCITPDVGPRTLVHARRLYDAAVACEDAPGAVQYRAQYCALERARRDLLLRQAVERGLG